jgi:DNA invertase Pin-like site-specific DNA recombinase
VTIAISYDRYSDPSQQDGDSLRRQANAREAWLKRHPEVRLDTSLSYQDKGRSGYHGKHRQGDLGRFLADVQAGRVPRGSFLLVENADRLSREKPVVGVNLISGLLLAGIRIVQLLPDELELTEDSDLFALFRSQMAQNNGHMESDKKAARMASVWVGKQAEARLVAARVTARVPHWVTIRGGELVVRNSRAKIVGGVFEVIPERAQVVRDIFRMALDGLGVTLIVRHLTRTVEPWSRGDGWTKSYVHRVLTSRTVLGEYQPRVKGRPDGKGAVVGYYPRVIDEDTWTLAQATLSSRRGRPGRVGAKALSYFSGLLWDARTGERVRVSNQSRGGRPGAWKKRRMLVPAGAMAGRRPMVGFPVDVFEPAVLAKLKEIKPADVFGAPAEGKSAALAAEAARAQSSIDALVADLDANGDSPLVLRRLREKEAYLVGVQGKLAEARAAERHPKTAALAEAQTLVDAATTPAARLRLRQLLRDTVESVFLLTVPRGAARLCAARIDFKEGRHRDFLICYWAAAYRREGRVETLSFAAAGADGLDLRKASDVKRVERLLQRLDLTGGEG